MWLGVQLTGAPAPTVGSGHASTYRNRSSRSPKEAQTAKASMQRSVQSKVHSWWCSCLCHHRMCAKTQRVLCCAVQVPVVFFSLLRKGTPDRDRSEAKLAEAFDYVSGSWAWSV